MLDSIAALKRQIEEFEPSIEWIPEEDCDTLLIFLPGFEKNQLRVQVTTNRKLTISGYRPLGDERWSRFQKEFQISENCETNGITAKFEGDILYIRQPKVITPAAGQDEERPNGEAPKTNHKPADEEQTKSSSDGQEHAPQQATYSIPASLPDHRETNRPKDEDWLANANNDISQTKAQEKEKKKENQPDARNGKSSGVLGLLADVKNDSQNETTSVKEKSDELKSGKATNDIKHEKLSNSADNSSAAKMNGADSNESYNQATRYLVMELKKKRKLFNLVMAVLLLALVIGLYATSWIPAYQNNLKP